MLSWEASRNNEFGLCSVVPAFIGYIILWEIGFTFRSFTLLLFRIAAGWVPSIMLYVETLPFSRICLIWKDNLSRIQCKTWSIRMFEHIWSQLFMKDKLWGRWKLVYYLNNLSWLIINVINKWVSKASSADIYKNITFKVTKSLVYLVGA